MASNIGAISSEQVFKPLSASAINAPHRTSGVYQQPSNDAVEISETNTREKPPKKNKLARGIAWVAGIAIAGGVFLYSGNKAGWFETQKYGVKYLKQAGEWVEQVPVEKGIKQAWKWAKGLVSKSETAAK